MKAQQLGIQRVGEYGDLEIAEVPARNTPLSGEKIRDTEIRKRTGANIIGVWERGPLEPPSPSYELTDVSVPVVMGTDRQIQKLNEMIGEGSTSSDPVIVIGGGQVGAAAIRSLGEEDVPVHLVEQKEERCEKLRPECENVFQGDAANYSVIHEAGIDRAAAVLVTTNHDPTNIYLTSYCRNLNPELRVVSRITHERNIDAMYRAGADFVLSYATLGVDAILSVLTDKKLVVLGEGGDLFSRSVPPSIAGQTVTEARIGAMTGLTVVALKKGDDTVTEFSPTTELDAEMELLMIGSDEQLESFIERYE